MQYSLLAISHAYRLLMQEEQHIQYSESTTETPQAFLGTNRSNQSYKPLHYNNSARGDPSRKSRPFCDYYKRTSHIRGNASS